MRSSNSKRVTVPVFVLMVVSLILAGCNQSTAVRHATPALDGQALQAQQWIQQHAVPLKTTDPTAPLDDLQAFSAIVGAKTLVGLGEATHGAHEIFTMKQRIVEYLVEKLGFTTFAIEGSWTAGQTINDYVLNGTGTAADGLDHMVMWPWHTLEVEDLIEWMRAYNADPSHTTKVRFAGFDCQNIEAPTYHNVERYIQQVDPAESATVTQLYTNIAPTQDTVLGTAAFLYKYAALPLATRQQYAKQAQQVYDLLTAHQAQDITNSSTDAFANALQDARVIVQATQFLANDAAAADQRPISNYRDAAMAENIAWLMSHSATKMAIWAHDWHIQNAPYAPGVVNMGARLRQQFRTNYLTILTSFYEGDFNAIPDTNGQASGTLGANYLMTPPLSGSYNQVLGSLSAPNYLLDLSKLPSSGTVAQWFAGPRGFIEIGAIFDDAQIAQSAYPQLSLSQAADVIISLQQTTPTQLLPFQ